MWSFRSLLSNILTLLIWGKQMKKITMSPNWNRKASYVKPFPSQLSIIWYFPWPPNPIWVTKSKVFSCKKIYFDMKNQFKGTNDDAKNSILTSKTASIVVCHSVEFFMSSFHCCCTWAICFWRDSAVRAINTLVTLAWYWGSAACFSYEVRKVCPWSMACSITTRRSFNLLLNNWKWKKVTNMKLKYYKVP